MIDLRRLLNTKSNLQSAGVAVIEFLLTRKMEEIPRGVQLTHEEFANLDPTKVTGTYWVKFLTGEPPGPDGVPKTEWVLFVCVPDSPSSDSPTSDSPDFWPETPPLPSSPPRPSFLSASSPPLPLPSSPKTSKFRKVIVPRKPAKNLIQKAIRDSDSGGSHRTSDSDHDYIDQRFIYK